MNNKTITKITRKSYHYNKLKYGYDHCLSIRHRIINTPKEYAIEETKFLESMIPTLGSTKTISKPSGWYCPKLIFKGSYEACNKRLASIKDTFTNPPDYTRWGIAR